MSYIYRPVLGIIALKITSCTSFSQIFKRTHLLLTIDYSVYIRPWILTTTSAMLASVMLPQINRFPRPHFNVALIWWLVSFSHLVFHIHYFPSLVIIFYNIIQAFSWVSDYSDFLGSLGWLALNCCALPVLFGIKYAYTQAESEQVSCDMFLNTES